MELLFSLVIPLKEVNCIEKSNVNANSGNVDEAIVFTMKNLGRNFVFGQVKADVLAMAGIFLLSFLSSILIKLSFSQTILIYHYKYRYRTGTK